MCAGFVNAPLYKSLHMRQRQKAWWSITDELITLHFQRSMHRKLCRLATVLLTSSQKYIKFNTIGQICLHILHVESRPRSHKYTDPVMAVVPTHHWGIHGRSPGGLQCFIAIHAKLTIRFCFYARPPSLPYVTFTLKLPHLSITSILTLSMLVAAMFVLLPDCMAKNIMGVLIMEYSPCHRHPTILIKIFHMCTPH